MTETIGMVNVYRCRNCPNAFATINRDDGVTPFIKTCPFCGGESQSMMYPKWAQKLQPRFEWYRPTEEEARAEDVLYPGMYQYWKDGGLSFRPIDPGFHSDAYPRGPKYLVVHNHPNRKARRAAKAKRG
jgi:hypothetical protein